MKTVAKYVLICVPIIISLYFIYLWSTAPGAYDNLAKCLTEKGAVMYGTDWCKSCQNQKSLFEKSFSYINYINCDYNKQACDMADVISYPTWRINNTNYSGLQSLGRLASLTGCSL